MKNFVIRTPALLTAVALLGFSPAAADSRVETTRIQTAEKIELATDIYHPLIGCQFQCSQQSIQMVYHGIPC